MFIINLYNARSGHYIDITARTRKQAWREFRRACWECKQYAFRGYVSLTLNRRTHTELF